MTTTLKHYSPADYLEQEINADLKSEYIDGEIIPMSGGAANHNQIIVNLVAALTLAFKHKPLRVFTSDLRLWVARRRIFTYPDVMIVSGPLVFYEDWQDTITNPQIIVEVLSRSTEQYNRTDKFSAYRTLATFQEYILIDRYQVYLEQWIKTGDRQWEVREYESMIRD
jgi:Uma2 family endonuclease